MDSILPNDKKEKILLRMKNNLEKLSKNEDFIKAKQELKKKFEVKKQEFLQKIQKDPEMMKKFQAKKDILMKRNNFRKKINAERKALRNNIKENFKNSWIENTPENARKFREEKINEFKEWVKKWFWEIKDAWRNARQEFKEAIREKKIEFGWMKKWAKEELKK